MITTGVSRAHVPVAFEPVLDAAVAEIAGQSSDASVYLYGSVATGMAVPGVSDVDILAVGIEVATAEVISTGLTARFSNLCRAVEIAPASAGDFAGDSDEAYGGRVFLRHYCVHLAGPGLDADLPAFAADARAARGFNGDIAIHTKRWAKALAAGADPGQLGRRVARKTLLAVAGLVSVHDGGWTTDRRRAAARWASIEPDHADEIQMLARWADGAISADGADIERALGGIVGSVVAAFEETIGLWNE